MPNKHIFKIKFYLKLSICYLSKSNWLLFILAKS